MSSATLGEFLSKTEHAFKKAKLYFGHGTNNPWDEAVAIAMAVLKLPPDVEKSILSRPLTEIELKDLEELVKKRVEGRIPVPYLSHQAWFAGLKFYVDERVIIPRSPLGELILNQFRPWWPKNKPEPHILDLCTGSACIAIACQYAFPKANIEALDISKEALEVAKINLLEHHFADRIHLINSDLFNSTSVGFKDYSKGGSRDDSADSLGEGKNDSGGKRHSSGEKKDDSGTKKAGSGKKYDIIISNPPYVSLSEMKSLPAEYQWEPRLALEAHEDGLSVVHRILKEAKNYLTEDGLLIVEVGNSEAALKKAYPNLPFTWLEFERGGQGVFLLRAGELF